MRAIGDRVIIKRDERDETFSGMPVSDKSKVDSYLGTVVSSGSDKFVISGDRIHLTHAGAKIQDFEFDGESYSSMRDGDFFAKEIDGEYLPINQFVKIRKCINEHEHDDLGNITFYRTDEHLENTNFCEILSISNDCKNLKQNDVGGFVYAPESNDRLERFLYTKDYFIHEDLIEFVTE